MARRTPQISMLAKERSAYGGDLLKTRAGRRRGRPLSTKETMHLVLRSSKAKGDWSFRRPRNAAHVSRIIDKFSVTYGVRVISMANVGNHLHLQIKLSNRFGYSPFIRAVTAAIAMAVTGRNRWSLAVGAEKVETSTAINPTRHAATDSDTSCERPAGHEKFWDYRPFTRVIEGFRALLGLHDYVRINQLEGAGTRREDARFMLRVEKNFAKEDDQIEAWPRERTTWLSTR